MPKEEGDAAPAWGEAAWRAAVARIVRAPDGRPNPHETYDGIPILPLYPARDDAPPQPQRASRACAIVQRIDHPDPDQANALALADLEGGAHGLCLSAADTATARGFGVPMGTAEDLDTMLSGIDLDRVAFRCEAPFDIAPAFAALTRARGLDPSLIDIDLGHDPLGTMARRGGAARGWAEEGKALRRGYDAFRAAGFQSPVLRSDARPYHEAGASEAQELASVLATGVAYLRLLEAGGVPLDDARRAISHLLVADVDLLVTIAKFRAFRRLWAAVAAACGLGPEPARLHAETGWRTLTRRDPWTNLLRGTIGCAGALLGGADSVTVLPFTVALGLPDAAARRLARNTALILCDESHLGHVTDPAAGSSAVEALTEELCAKAWSLFQGIEAAGGFPQALVSGEWQRRIDATSEARRRDIARGEPPLTGSSRFPHLGEVSPAVLAPMPSRRPVAPLDQAAAWRCDALKSHRDAEPFECLRDRSDAWRAARGTRPRVTVTAPCSSFARGALDVGGFDVVIVGDDAASQARTAEAEALLVEGCDLVAGLNGLWDGGLVS